MKKIIFGIILASSLLFQGCGYESRNGEIIGQVKNVARQTPLVCSEYNMTNISLGVMRNGVGSMSTEDVELEILNKEDVKLLTNAMKSGQLVHIFYDTKRVCFCTPRLKVLNVELVK